MIRENQITTREAALFLGVHESTIKRLCNQGTIEHHTTQGGHRRLLIPSLLQYARQAGMPERLARLGPWEYESFTATNDLLAGVPSEQAASLVYQWTADLNAQAIGSLFGYMAERGVPPEVLGDEVIANVMRRMGQDWYEGKISVGEEHMFSNLIRDALYEYHTALQYTQMQPQNPSNLRALVGCADSSMHEMGALLMRFALEYHGIRVLYLGQNVPVADFVDLLERKGADLVCVSVNSISSSGDAIRLLEAFQQHENELTRHMYILGGPGLDTFEMPDSPWHKTRARTFGRLQDCIGWLHSQAYIGGEAA